MLTKNQSDRLTEADCCRQMGWYKNDLSPNSFVFTRGMTKVRVSDAEHNFLVGVSGCIRPERY